ncbi:hypothetical protein ACWEOW_10140 [Monashia sp. NPDC004114]
MDTDRTYADSRATSEQSWNRLTRTLGVLGLVTVPLLFAPTIAISTLGEPDFSGPPGDVTAFLDAVSQTSWAPAATALQILGSLALLWWAVGFAVLLRRHEGEPAWRSTVALASIVIFAAYVVLEPFWAAASARGSVSRELAVFAFDAGNIGFANSWLALGSFAVACGWVVLSARALPRWLGWLAVASGVGFVLARLDWTSGAWFLPYAAFWVWVVAVCVVLLRRGASETAHPLARA